MSVAVTDNSERQRFEVRDEGRLAGFLEYERAAGAVTLLHTEVDPAFGGRGLGGQLVRFAAEETARAGLRLAVVCEYARGWLTKHPEYGAPEATHRTGGT